MKPILFASICMFLAGSFSRAFLWAGLAAETAYLGMRGLSMGRLPLLGPHDTLVCFSAAIALMALVTSFSPVLAGKGWFAAVSGLGAALFTLAALVFPPLNMPLPQILDTRWFEAHVVLAFLAYALFSVGALLCAGYLGGRERHLLDLQYKTALVGWSFFSVS
ncbi:MAG TPA: cytochrome c biogenesis protein CcsA, partial [Desulfuromonadaceae bacterium]